MPNRAAAIRHLLKIALKAKMGGKAKSGRRSQDYGLLTDEEDCAG